jgi:tryptophan synthase alpha chain
LAGTTKLTGNRVVRAFAELRSAGRKTLVPFVTAGYPDLAATAAILKEFEARGVRVCELGVPFSDPVADGPVIQTSYTRALGAGVTVREVFDAVRAYRAEGGGLALLAMVSYSIVFRRGPEQFLVAAARAGLDGLIVPDLPLDEAAGFEPLAASRGLANVLLVAPTTLPERRVEIAGHCTGFVYYVSVRGITGERDRLPEETIAGVAELRRHTDTPICVGFGVSRPEMVAAVCEAADGAIVGSAIVHRITDARDLPAEKLAARIGDFVAELLAPLL